MEGDFGGLGFGKNALVNRVEASETEAPNPNPQLYGRFTRLLWSLGTLTPRSFGVIGREI